MPAIASRLRPVGRHERNAKRHLRAVLFQSRLRQNAPIAARNAVLRRIILSEEDVEMNIPEQVRRESSLPLPSEEAASERDHEARKIRRLQVMISMVMSVIGQDPSLTVEEASELAAGAKRAALAMFPDKELAFDLLYKPRLQRLMRERFRLQ
jgi:hypothetical protein